MAFNVWVYPAVFCSGHAYDCDPDAFNVSVFICPPDMEFKYDQLKVPMDPSLPNLKHVF